MNNEKDETANFAFSLIWVNHRLGEVYIPWVYTPAATLRKIVVYQLACRGHCWYLLAPFTSQAYCAGGSSLLSVN